MAKELKHNILQKLAETIPKAYPTADDLKAVAKALLNTHPSRNLQEPGSPSGWVDKQFERQNG